MASQRSRSVAAVAIAAVVALLIWIVQYRVGSTLGDLPTYEHAYRLIAAGQVPYRDFMLEYPPGAAGLFWLSGALPGPYALTFSVLMFGCLLLTMLGVHRTASALQLGVRAQAVGCMLVAVMPALMGQLTESRFDLAVAALLAWTAWAVARERWTTVWLLIGAAVLLKLFPIVFVPVLIIAQLRTTRVRNLVVSMAPGVGLVLVGIGPFVAIAPGGTWTVVGYELARPLQIESLGSAVVLMLHHNVSFAVAHTFSFGSNNLIGAVPAYVGTVTMGIGLMVIALIAFTTSRAMSATTDPHMRARLTVQALAATTATIVATDKVLSPQYLLWLLPLIPLIEGRRGLAAIMLLVVAVAWRLPALSGARSALNALATGPSALLAVRDLALVLLIAATWPSWRHLRSPRPVAAPAAERPPDGPHR